jgi:hypothetical protein
MSPMATKVNGSVAGDGGDGEQAAMHLVLLNPDVLRPGVYGRSLTLA